LSDFKEISAKKLKNSSISKSSNLESPVLNLILVDGKLSAHTVWSLWPILLSLIAHPSSPFSLALIKNLFNDTLSFPFPPKQ